MKNSAVLGILGVALTATLLSCSKPKAPEFRGVENVKVENVTGDSATVSLNILYFNPNDYDLSVKNVACDILANESVIGRYQVDSVYKIPASLQGTYPARMRVSLKPIYANALSALLNKQVILHFKGSAKVGRGGFYLTVPIDFSKTQKLDFF